MSTSLNPFYALRFSKVNYTKCCIKIITLLPGTKCLLLDGIAYMDKLQEIVLPYGTKMYNTDKSDHKLYYSKNTEEFVCPKNDLEIKTINLVCL